MSTATPPTTMLFVVITWSSFSSLRELLRGIRGASYSYDGGYDSVSSDLGWSGGGLRSCARKNFPGKGGGGTGALTFLAPATHRPPPPTHQLVSAHCPPPTPPPAPTRPH